MHSVVHYRFATLWIIEYQHLIAFVGGGGDKLGFYSHYVDCRAAIRSITLLRHEATPTMDNQFKITGDNCNWNKKIAQSI